MGEGGSSQNGSNVDFMLTPDHKDVDFVSTTNTRLLVSLFVFSILSWSMAKMNE